jgi:hypothetical protein
VRVCGTSENPLDSTEPAFDGIYEVNAPRLHHPLHGLHCEGHLNLLGDPERPLTGSLEVLECGWTIALDAPAQTGRRGRRKRYSDVAIEAGLMLRPAFGRPWRQTESMLGSIMGLLGLDLPVPEPVRASAAITRFSCRSADLGVVIALKKASARGDRQHGADGVRVRRVVAREARWQAAPELAKAPSGGRSRQR